jgi:hypothetical protein
MRDRFAGFEAAAPSGCGPQVALRPRPASPVPPGQTVGDEAEYKYAYTTSSGGSKTSRKLLEGHMDDVHLLWLGLIGIFVLIAIGVIALSLLPVRDRR